MSYVNIWLAIPEDDHNELNNRRGTEDNVGPARDFVDGQLDPEVVQNLYVTHQQGQTVRHLWSVILREDSIPNSVNEFRQEFPGAQVLGCWKPDGAMLGCERVLTEVPNPEYLGEPKYIPNPGYDPETDTREEIKNPAWVPEFIVQITQTGTPQYEPGNIANYMPGGVVGDYNLPAGWSPRIFT
jgi:hypothetical protein